MNEEKKTTIRFNEEELVNLTVIKNEIIQATTNNGAIKFVINNFIKTANLLKIRNEELRKLKQENEILKCKIKNFYSAFESLKL